MSRDRDDYWGDVLHDMWLFGGDLDRVDECRVEGCRWKGMEHEDATRIELRHHQPAKEVSDDTTR